MVRTHSTELHDTPSSVLCARSNISQCGAKRRGSGRGRRSCKCKSVLVPSAAQVGGLQCGCSKRVAHSEC
jgi:hypothetical protein